MKPKCTIPTEWIHLRSGKEFSRLLYTNPVCFLATTSSQPFKNTDRGNCGKASPASKKYDPSTHNDIKRNVMVLSWLTATNNEGHFLFSIHKSRYSSQLLLAPRGVDGSSDGGSNYIGVEFSLSVPVKGMEEIVLDVGSISGRFCSKFQSDAAATSLVEVGLVAQQPEGMDDNLSNRRRKKQKKQNIKDNGIIGLVPIPIGNEGESDLFAIKGTVAHLRCRAYSVIGNPSSDNLDATIEKAYCANSTQPAVDDDHLLIMAEVIDAYVHPSYWDPNKMLFRPLTKEREQTVPPYLTFFGSQTFGYVVSSCDVI